MRRRGAEPADRARIRRTASQPNIVFIYTDDQDYSSFNRRIMPHTFAEIVDHGTDFTNYYDADPALLSGAGRRC